MNNKVFQECLRQKEKVKARGKFPFWDMLAKKHGYKSGEHLRNDFKNECRRRNIIFDGQGLKQTDTSSFEQGDDFINIVCASPRMMTKEGVLAQFRVDENQWKVESFKVKTSEGYRKDRQVSWHVKGGNVISGDVEDTGKMLVVPLFHIEVRLKRKTEEIRARNVLEELVEDARKFAPKYPRVKYPKQKDGLLYEIAISDLHFGRLTWHSESGKDFDVRIAERDVHKVLDELLRYSTSHAISRILLPLGNDFFNVNSKTNTTVNGTLQQEDTRWQKTFKLGRELAVGMIDKCARIAPVDVLIVKGNHDEERTFYLGEALECWYNRNPNVSIDNGAKARKYYSFGSNLIGFTHGSSEKLERLPMLMTLEVPELWAASTHREFHTGHKHRKYETSEEGITIRILRALAEVDAWTYEKGFIGSQRAAEGFMWHPTKGLVAQFTASP